MRHTGRATRAGVPALALSIVIGAGGAARAETPASGADAVTMTARLLIQSDAIVAHQGPDAPPIEDGTTRPGLYLRRARVGLDATVGPWRARAMAELAARPELAGGAPDAIAGELGGGDGRPRATEAFVAFAPHKAFVLAAGSQRVPIGLSRRIDEADLRLPERPRIVTRATPDFRAGVSASGDLGLLQYSLGTYAAAPALGPDFARGGALTVLRLGAEPVGPVGIAPQLRPSDDPWYRWWRFSAGLSAFYSTLPGPNEAGLGGDGQFQWARLCVAGEVLWTRRDHADRVGFAVEPGVFIAPDRVELVARAEWLNDEVGPQSLVDGWGASLGATFLSAARHARLQAAYTIRHTLTGNDKPSGWAVLRATLTL